MDVFALTMRLKEEGAGQVRAAVDKLRQSFKATAKDAKVLNNATAEVSSQFKNLATSLTAVVGAGAAMRAIDAYAQMTNQLKLATSSSAEFAAAQQQVIAIAARTNQPLESVAELYGKVSRSAAALGLSQDQVAKLTENVNKALLINKTDAGAAAGGMIQLSQALSNGVVRAEEFNSIMESMPPLIQAIEKEAGLVPGTLRRMAVAGTLTSAEFAKAMVNNRRITEQFATYVPTVSQQLVGLRNNFVLLAGKVGEVTGFTDKLSQSIGWLKNNLPTVIGLVGGLAAMWGTYKAALLGAAAVTALITGMETLASLFALAKAVKSVGDAVAFVSLATGGWARLLGVVVALGAGYTTFNYIMNRLDGVMGSLNTKIAEQAARLQYLAKTNVTLHGVLADTTVKFGGVVEKTKSYMEMLVELAGLVPITTTQQAQLVAEEARLGNELKRTNLSMAARVKLATELKNVQQALGEATVKYTLAESAQRFLQQAGTFGAQPLKRGFDVKMIDPASVKAAVGGLKPSIDLAKAEFNQQMEAFASDLDNSLKNTLIDGFVSGIETAISSGSITKGLKALGATILSGLGNILIQLGSAMLPVSKLVAKLWASLSSLNPIGMAAAAVGLIAIGAAMRGIAGRITSGGMGGGGAAAAVSAPALAQGGGMTLPTQFYGPTSAGSASTIERVNPVNVTIIGPNDPAAQRQMQELIRNADRRGSV